MKIIMEGNVDKLKNNIFGAFKTAGQQHMVLTDQPRLYLMTPFNEKDPKP